MCLDTITAKHKPTTEVIEAWKVMQRGASREVLRFPFYARTTRAVSGRWLKATRKRTGGGYMSGFHIFETIEGANAYMGSPDPWELIVLPVKVRGVRVRGKEDIHPVLVADEIMFPELPERRRAAHEALRILL